MASLLLAGCLTAAALMGILFREALYPSKELLHAFLPNDIVTLAIEIPILLLSEILSDRGMLAGLLLWPGALLFVVYNSLAYALALPVNALFLLHLTSVCLGVFTLAGLLAAIDSRAAGSILNDRIPNRAAGAILASLGILFLIRAAVVFLGAMLGTAALAATDQAVNMSDFLITPAWILGGLFLWKKTPFGLTVGLGLLFQASMLFVALIVFLALQPLLTGGPFAPADILVIFVMGCVCFVPFGFYLRGVVRSGR
jgi:hypothetical protein